MNPPGSDDDPNPYAGSEPLDRALADRFPIIVDLPDWDALSPEQQQSVILTDHNAPPPQEAAERLSDCLARARAILTSLHESFGRRLSGYVRMACSLLRQAGLDISPRRAAMLYRNVIAVHAVRLATYPGAKLEDSACLALTHSLCERAYGEKIPALKVGAAHKQAWASSLELHGADFDAVLTEPDPIRRIALASTLSLGKAEFSTVAADCLASVGPGARHAIAVELFEGPGADRLVSAVAEQCGELYRVVCVPKGVTESVRAGSPEHATWKRIVRRLADLGEKTSENARAHNLLVGLFSYRELQTESDVDRVLDGWLHASALLKGLRQ
jgi:MoxR-like ATPase